MILYSLEGTYEDGEEGTPERMRQHHVKGQHLKLNFKMGIGTPHVFRQSVVIVRRFQRKLLLSVRQTYKAMFLLTIFP